MTTEEIHDETPQVVAAGRGDRPNPEIADAILSESTAAVASSEEKPELLELSEVSVESDTDSQPEEDAIKEEVHEEPEAETDIDATEPEVAAPVVDPEGAEEGPEPAAEEEEENANLQLESAVDDAAPVEEVTEPAVAEIEPSVDDCAPVEEVTEPAVAEIEPSDVAAAANDSEAPQDVTPVSHTPEVVAESEPSEAPPATDSSAALQEVKSIPDTPEVVVAEEVKPTPVEQPVQEPVKVEPVAPETLVETPEVSKVEKAKRVAPLIAEMKNIFSKPGGTTTCFKAWKCVQPSKQVK